MKHMASCSRWRYAASHRRKIGNTHTRAVSESIAEVSKRLYQFGKPARIIQC